jgi:hypothetical protein
MPLSELQAALARILTDETLRERFVKSHRDDPIPEDLRLYGLSHHEWNQLLEVRRDRFNLYAHLLRDKRIAKLPETLPWTWLLLRQSLKRLVPEYCRKPPVSIRKLDEARSFYNFLLEQASPLEPGYVMDVARYEIVVRELTEQGRLRQPGESRVEWPSGHAASPLFGLLSVVRNGSEVMEFNYNLDEILPHLEQGHIPPEPAAAKTPVIFAAPSGQRARGYVLSKAAAALLDLCDGRLSVRGIVERSAGAYARDAQDRSRLEAACFQGLKTFVSAGIAVLCPMEQQ